MTAASIEFRPEMERQPACKLSVIIFIQQGRSDDVRDLNIAAGQSFPAQTGESVVLGEMEERQ